MPRERTAFHAANTRRFVNILLFSIVIAARRAHASRARDNLDCLRAPTRATSRHHASNYSRARVLPVTARMSLASSRAPPRSLSAAAFISRVRSGQSRSTSRRETGVRKARVWETLSPFKRRERKPLAIREIRRR